VEVIKQKIDSAAVDFLFYAGKLACECRPPERASGKLRGEEESLCDGLVKKGRQLLRSHQSQHAVEHRNHFIDLFGRAIQCGHKPQ
jgi:hypothetical protein